MIWCPGASWLLAGTGVVQVLPSADDEITMRPSPLDGLGLRGAYPRADHARYARLAASIASVGNALVRNEVLVVPCSNGLKVVTTLGGEKDNPPLVERTVTIASGNT